MKRIGKLAFGALLMAGTAMGVTLATTAPADARVSIGIGIGIPGPGYGNPCDSPRFRYYHPERCDRGDYGPDYYGYYDSGFYGPGYYEPGIDGFWFTDGFGHRRFHGGAFHGGGFHGHSGWSGGHGGGHGGWGGGGHHHH